ncbi:MAG: HAD-IB family phosphatase [Terriglobales bacterium]|jgi:HAD superfamily phosphoserine phosphatase-like hydrolase
MASKNRKHYLFASDFDQTLTFNDTGYVLSEMLGISVEEFERKAKGMAKLNLVQQGAELSYLLLHDPEFHSRVRRDDLIEAGKRIRLKDNIKQVYEILDRKIDGFHFDFYVISASPVEVIQSALEGIVPADHIFGTEFNYKASGEIDCLVRATAGYGKVWRLDQLEEQLGIPSDHIVYVGDGSSDIHVMLQVNRRDGFTIAVSESKLVAQIAKRTVLSDNALPTLVPILEDIAGWQRSQIRQLFDSYGFLIQGWDRVQTDWVTLRPSAGVDKVAAVEAH